MSTPPDAEYQQHWQRETQKCDRELAAVRRHGPQPTDRAFAKRRHM
jgi:hypothetical protein